jgi:hypothetical protein
MNIMKKQYILPSTTTVAFNVGLICAGSPGAGTKIVGNALGGGGEAPGTIEPM